MYPQLNFNGMEGAGAGAGAGGQDLLSGTNPSISSEVAVFPPSPARSRTSTPTASFEQQDLISAPVPIGEFYENNLTIKQECMVPTTGKLHQGPPMAHPLSQLPTSSPLAPAPAFDLLAPSNGFPASLPSRPASNYANNDLSISQLRKSLDLLSSNPSPPPPPPSPSPAAPVAENGRLSQEPLAKNYLPPQNHYSPLPPKLYILGGIPNGYRLVFSPFSSP